VTMAGPGPVSDRFGVSVGDAQLVTTAGLTTIYTPQSGRALRLKYVALLTPSTNSGPVVVAVILGTDQPYLVPLSAPGAFAHACNRKGVEGGVLAVNLSDSQDVYVNFDVSEF
jgi:hypothetical protein